MSKSFQQQSLQRKLIYFSLIVVLFFATLVLRNQYVVAKAEDLGLREKNQGKVELPGSVLRLTLTGSRGLVVSALWYMAQDTQMRHEWNELELLVRTLTKLQPHFVTPWLFQSWNLAYNVSVEPDRIQDKYFYISRGLDLLAEGERQNQDNPDLREHMGIYYQSKIGLSDEHNTLRSLFQMSCIDPKERDPARFRASRKEREAVDKGQLEDFCRAHPFLVRRLYDILGCQTPGELVDFLEDNKKVPSRFDEKARPSPTGGTPLKAQEERFPILPPRTPLPPFDQDEFTNDSLLGDTFDNYMAARAWFGYAQEPLKLPQARKPKESDIVFTEKPCLAQAHVADQLEIEGWFDEPWEVTEWFPRNKTGSEGGEGKAKFNWPGDAWRRAHQLFKYFGETNGLFLSGRPHDTDRVISNFTHWLSRSEVEMTPEAVTARKRFFEAERHRLGGDPAAWVVEKYEDKGAFGPPSTWNKDKATGWTRFFFDNKYPEFRSDQAIQEETYGLELKYMDAVKDAMSPQVKQATALQAAVAATAAAGLQGAVWPISVHLSGAAAPTVKGPFDGVNEQGKPILTDNTIHTVKMRRGDMGPAPSKPASSPAGAAGNAASK